MINQKLNSLVRVLALLVVVLAHTSCSQDLEDQDAAFFSYPSCSDAIFEYNGIEDSFEILGVEFVGDCLELVIGYPGGCEQHEFQLLKVGDVGLEFVGFGTGSLGLVPVPIQEFRLIHNSNGDACRAYFETPVSFDLNSIKDETNEVVVLQIDGLPGKWVHNF